MLRAKRNARRHARNKGGAGRGIQTRPSLRPVPACSEVMAKGKDRDIDDGVHGNLRTMCHKEFLSVGVALEDLLDPLIRHGSDH